MPKLLFTVSMLFVSIMGFSQTENSPVNANKATYDTLAIRANLYWKKGTKLIDPYKNKAINLSPRGKSTVIYLNQTTGKVMVADITQDEMENKKVLKFKTYGSCMKWHRLHPDFIPENF